MKKILIICLLFFFLTGCSNPSNKSNSIENIENEIKEDLKDKEQEIVEKIYEDYNDIKFSIYRFDGQKYAKSTDCSEIWNNNSDIAYYTIFYSQEDEIYTNYFKGYFENLRNNFNSRNAKHGFNFKFNSVDGEISKTILKPDDVWEIFPYIQIYLYDDLEHSGDSWYSHTEQNQVTDKTLFTTFKITMGESAKILSDIKVTAFTYDSQDDFKDNEYIGNSSYSFNLKRKQIN